MRSDFHHAVGEPTKHGRAKTPNPARMAKRIVLDENLDPVDSITTQKLSLRHGLGYNRGHSWIRLGLVDKFLSHRVGRHWNEVYSELCQHLSTDSPVQYRIRSAVLYNVAVKTCRGADGRVYEGDSYHTCDSKIDFYVEPETGLLRQGTHPRR